MTTKQKPRKPLPSVPVPTVSADQILKRIEALEAQVKALKWQALFPPSPYHR